MSHRRLDLCIENQAAIVSRKLAPISQSGHLCPQTLTNSQQRARDLINKVNRGKFNSIQQGSNVLIDWGRVHQNCLNFRQKL